MFANHQAFHRKHPLTHRLYTLALGGLLASSVVSSAWCIEISTAEGLNALRNRNDTYKLTADINLSDYTSWIPIGNQSHPFTGRLDGNGHSISGLNATTTTVDTPAGLFGYLKDGWIHNLFLDQPYILSINDGSPAGAIAGKMVHSNVTHVIKHLGSVETRGAQQLNSDNSTAGGLVGLAQDGSRIKNNLNTGPVSTTGIGADAGGVVGVAHTNSIVSGNLNTGSVRTTEDEAKAGGAVGVAHTNSTVSGNLNTGSVSTTHRFADAGGVVGVAHTNSPVSGNLNTGPISTTGIGADAGGGVGYANDNSPVSGNLNTGPIRTIHQVADAGGAVGEASCNSPVRGNLNSGSVTTNGKRADAGTADGYGYKADAGGAVGATSSNSSVSGNLNTGPVSASGTYAGAGGAVGEASHNSSVSGNLNTGPVSINGNNATAGGAVGYADDSSLVSGNLNTGRVSANGSDAVAGGAVGHTDDSSLVSGNLNSGQVSPLQDKTNALNLTSLDKNGLQGLSEDYWDAGDNDQYPMLKGINPAYQDLLRINGTRYGNNTFPLSLNEFALPGGNTSDSLFDPMVWNVREGYLPFLKSVTLEKAGAANIDCTPGGFDCFPASCQFIFQSSGSMKYLLYDGTALPRCYQG